MGEKPYPFELKTLQYRYEFWSVSDEKSVKKVVAFSYTGHQNLYNVALLDEVKAGEYSDKVETNNQDFITIIATVFQIISDFLSQNPQLFVVFRGSDERRQRIYRIILGRELSKILKQFEVFGSLPNGIIEPFVADTDYEFYLIKKI